RNESRLGDNADWMTGPVEDLQDGPRDAVLALDGLVGIRHSAERDRARPVAGTRQLLFEQLGGIRFGVELRFEVEPRRMPEIAVGRSGVAVNAAVLAPTIRVYGAVETDVGTVVAGNDAAGNLDPHLGLEGLQLGQAFPAVVEFLAKLGFVSAHAIGARTTPSA